MLILLYITLLLLLLLLFCGIPPGSCMRNVWLRKDRLRADRRSGWTAFVRQIEVISLEQIGTAMKIDSNDFTFLSAEHRSFSERQYAARCRCTYPAR